MMYTYSLENESSAEFGMKSARWLFVLVSKGMYCYDSSNVDGLNRKIINYLRCHKHHEMKTKYPFRDLQTSVGLVDPESHV